MAAEAWATTVKETTVKKSWSKLRPASTFKSRPMSEEPTNENFVSDVIELMRESPGFEECDQEDVHQQLECEGDDLGYRLEMST